MCFIIISWHDKFDNYTFGRPPFGQSGILLSNCWSSVPPYDYHFTLSDAFLLNILPKTILSTSLSKAIGEMFSLTASLPLASVSVSIDFAY